VHKHVDDLCKRPKNLCAAHLSRLAGSTGCHWLARAAEMADLASGNQPLSPDPAPMDWTCLPRIATRTPGVDAGSVRAARDFTIATLQWWGVTERSGDIAVVVSELLTNALPHALPGFGDTRPRWPIRLGLLQPGRCVLCAVADPSELAPVPKTPVSLAETGRGLHIICALSDKWGYTPPNDMGKVVWAMFSTRLAAPWHLQTGGWSGTRRPEEAASEHVEQFRSAGPTALRAQPKYAITSPGISCADSAVGLAMHADLGAVSASAADQDVEWCGFLDCRAHLPVCAGHPCR